MEIITGIERRRRWGAADKLRIVAETQLPGARIADVARRYEISRGLLWNWRHQVRRGVLRQPEVPTFVPVRVATEATVSGPMGTACGTRIDHASTAGRIEVRLPDGTAVRIEGEVSLTTLRQVMTVLRR
jgi:transposase